MQNPVDEYVIIIVVVVISIAHRHHQHHHHHHHVVPRTQKLRNPLTGAQGC